MSVIIGLSVLAIFTVLLTFALCKVSGEQSEQERLREWCDEMNKEDEDDAEVH